MKVRAAAKLLRGRVLVALSGMGSAIEKRLADLAGVDEEQMPLAARTFGLGVLWGRGVAPGPPFVSGSFGTPMPSPLPKVARYASWP